MSQHKRISLSKGTSLSPGFGDLDPNSTEITEFEWTRLEDPATNKPFFYCVATGESQWRDPSAGFDFGGAEGRWKALSTAATPHPPPRAKSAHH